MESEHDTSQGAETFRIRNMVCDRCILIVHELFNRLGLAPRTVELGVVRADSPADPAQRERLRQELQALGFELLDDAREQLVEAMKNEIVRLVRSDDALHIPLSEHLTATFHHEYSVLSKLFSEIAGSTVERYFIAQRIERVKELLSYGELSLSQIADRMNYSSVAHLSTQFKQVTGITPSRFRNQPSPARLPLDKVR